MIYAIELLPSRVPPEIIFVFVEDDLHRDGGGRLIESLGFTMCSHKEEKPAKVPIRGYVISVFGVGAWHCNMKPKHWSELVGVLHHEAVERLIPGALKAIRQL